MKSKKIAKSLFSMAALFCFWLSLMVIIFPAGQNPEALPAAANAAIDVKETIAKEEIVYPQSRKLVPLGLTTGIKMFSGGAMIVNFSALSQNGGKSPAQEAGLEVGDVIIGFNGQKVASNADLVSCLTACSNHNIELEIMRQNQIKTVAVKGISGGSGAGYKIGAWVRDSIAGIGTITFVDPQNGAFGALGHGISDGDTGQLMLFENGSIMESSVSGVKKGQSGDPGELTGRFDLTRDQGVLYSNTNLGIFGKITDKTLYSRYTPMETASKNEIKTGKAYIFCNVQDQQRNKYEI